VSYARRFQFALLAERAVTPWTMDHGVASPARPPRLAAGVLPTPPARKAAVQAEQDLSASNQEGEHRVAGPG